MRVESPSRYYLEESLRIRDLLFRESTIFSFDLVSLEELEMDPVTHLYGSINQSSKETTDPQGLEEQQSLMHPR